MSRYDSRKKKYRKRGLGYFIRDMGIFRLGLMSGGSYLLILYLVRIKFNLLNFELIKFTQAYLVWWPLIVAFGALASYIIWIIDIEES